MKKNSRKKSSRKVLKLTKKSTKTVKGNKPIKRKKSVKNNLPTRSNELVKRKKSVKNNLPLIGGSNRHVKRQMRLARIKKEVNDYINSLDLKKIESSEFTVQRENEIGKGQFGKVFNAKMGTDLCVFKELEQGVDPQLLKQEAIAMNKLDNVNIVSIIGIAVEGEGANPIGILMERCDKGDLLNFILKKKSHTVKQFNLFTCFNDIINGMIYIHGQNIIHCDLAARNILIKEETRGETRYVCKISDFGLSSEATGTRTIDLVPFRWYAPECIYGTKITERLDVWSFGCIIIEILNAGKIPYPELSQLDIIQLLKILMFDIDKDVKIWLLKKFNHFQITATAVNELLLNFLLKNIFVDSLTRKSFEELNNLIAELKDKLLILNVCLSSEFTESEAEEVVENIYDPNHTKDFYTIPSEIYYSREEEGDKLIYRDLSYVRPEVGNVKMYTGAPGAGAPNNTSIEKSFTLKRLHA